MNLHEQIVAVQAKYIEERSDCAIISPGALASATLQTFTTAALEPHVEYACLEHFKQMGRKALAARFEPDGEQNEAHPEGELFSGHLQQRYPMPRKGGEEPQYKRRELLTADERSWNVKRMRKSADGLLAHADALEAEGMETEAA